jgi:hypothetical protein
MDISSRYRKNVRTFYAWIASMVLLGIGPIVGEKLIDGGSHTERVLGVTLAMLAWVPWIWIVIGMIRHGDEFSLRVHLVGLSFAFLCLMVVLAALDWLTRAAFIEAPPFAFIWAGGLVLWLVGILTANHYYQRGS